MDHPKKLSDDQLYDENINEIISAENNLNNASGITPEKSPEGMQIVDYSFFTPKYPISPQNPLQNNANNTVVYSSTKPNMKTIKSDSLNISSGIINFAVEKTDLQSNHKLTSIATHSNTSNNRKASTIVNFSDLMTTK